MTICSGFSHWTWWFSIAMLVHQKVPWPWQLESFWSMHKVHRGHFKIGLFREGLHGSTFPSFNWSWPVVHSTCANGWLTPWFLVHWSTSLVDLAQRAAEPSMFFWSFGRYSHIFKHMGMDQHLLIPFLGGWTSIYQLFWCSPGVLLVLTHCHILTMKIGECFPSSASPIDPFFPMARWVASAAKCRLPRSLRSPGRRTWWENGGKMVGKWWENGGKMVGKWWENDGKTVDMLDGG